MHVKDGPAFIAHRINTPDAMRTLPAGLGAEFDVRSHFEADGQLSLHIAHDPWPLGYTLKALLQAYAARNGGGLLIVNTKEDGLETHVAAAMAQHGIADYIFLDTCIPTLRKACEDGAGAHYCLRVSDCESASFFAGLPTNRRPKWAWIDCFGGIPLPVEQVKALAGCFQLCLVSPELHLKHNEAQLREGLRRIPQFMPLAKLAHAICTKRPDLWKHHIAQSAGPSTPPQAALADRFKAPL
jgi:hypothetical protein